MSTAFEILVGARALYESSPHHGALVAAHDGQFSYCALGCLAKAGGKPDDLIAQGESEGYDEILLDQNGIEEAVRVLAGVIIDRADDGQFSWMADIFYDEDDGRKPWKEYVALAKQKAKGRPQEILWEYIHDFNDSHTPVQPRRTGLYGAELGYDWTVKITPAPEVLSAFDEAIKRASK